MTNNIHFSFNEFLSSLVWRHDPPSMKPGTNRFWMKDWREFKKNVPKDHRWGYIELKHPSIKNHRIFFRAQYAKDSKFHSEVISLKELVVNYCPMEIAAMTSVTGQPYSHKMVIQKFRRVDKNLKFTILPNLNILVERDTSSEAIIRQL